MSDENDFPIRPLGSLRSQAESSRANYANNSSYSEVFETYNKCEKQMLDHMREFGATQLIDAGSTIAVGGNVFRNKCGWVAVATALEILSLIHI
jgi:hypothetical protein